MKRNLLFILAFLVVASTAIFAGKRDQATEVSPVVSLTPASRTASSTDGTAVDLAGFDSATILVNVGVYDGDANDVFGWDIKESTASDGTFTSVASTDIVGSTVVVDSTTEMNTTYWFGYIGDERFIKVSGVAAGSPSTGVISSGVVLRGRPIHMPTQ